MPEDNQEKNLKMKKMKSFFFFAFEYMDNIFSVSGGHFQSGVKINDKSIETLKEMLDEDISEDSHQKKKFKEADFWIILGDFNFRINLSYNEVMSLILEKKYNDLYSMDQFSLASEENEYLKNNINEGKINFAPPYKFEENSDTYDKGTIPSWSDRIFYCKKEGIRIMSYNSVPNLKLSTHRPVIATFEVIPQKKEVKNKNILENDEFNGWEVMHSD